MQTQGSCERAKKVADHVYNEAGAPGNQQRNQRKVNEPRDHANAPIHPSRYSYQKLPGDPNTDIIASPRMHRMHRLDKHL